MIQIFPTSLFKKDLKRLKRKRVDITLLDEVVELIIKNDMKSKTELIRRHKMHKLKGNWKGSNECHVANVGDWLLVWRVKDGKAYLQRTGEHDEIFK